MAVVPITVRRKVTAPLIVGVIARSEISREGLEEDAWVSMITGANRYVLLVEFKANDWGEEAWAHAVKYGKRLAQQLSVSFRKKRCLAI